ncbi:MAG: hypothetical protein KKB51_18745 [Candidatus Riflebacteria bacterium]|nr:hypothetical protein [Candidatus Riflebacteria bacterium]
MNSIVFPTLVIAFLLFAAGEKSMQLCQTPKRKFLLLALWLSLGIPGFLIPLYYLHWFDNAKWFYEFRSLPYTELTCAVTGLFLGGLVGFLPGPRIFARTFLVIFLCICIIAPHLKPVLAPLANQSFSDRWRENVCLQSTQSSCGAASAATVFRQFGINLTEHGIARECFTYAGGTENWYIARAFRNHGLIVRYRIEDGFPADLQTPAIAGVRLGGIGHFIAILGQSDGKIVTGDPLIGLKEVPIDHIKKEFDFTGFFMEIGKKVD